MTDTATRLLAIVVSHFGVIETLEANPLDAQFGRDFQYDSLDPIELSMLIEEEFRIELSDDEVVSFAPDATLRQVLALVDGKLAGRVVA